MMHRYSFVLAAAMLVLAAPTLHSQPPAAAPTAMPVAAATRPSTRPSSNPLLLRDPTRPDARLRQALESPTFGDAPAARQGPRIPQITRRGFIQMIGQPPEAILEIQGAGMHAVKEGSIVTAGLSDDRPIVLRIDKLSADRIEIEFTTLKETVIVR